MRAPLTANLIGTCVVIAILILFVSEPKDPSHSVEGKQ